LLDNIRKRGTWYC